MNKIFATLFILTSVSQAIPLNGESIYESERLPIFPRIEINNNSKLILSSRHITIPGLLIIKKGGIVALDPESRFESSITLSDNGRIIDENLDMILTPSSSEDDLKRWLGFYKFNRPIN